MAAEIITPQRRKELLAEREEELLVAEKTGQKFTKKHPQVGAKFVIQMQHSQRFIVDINAADMVELLWATDVSHFTDHELFTEQEKKMMTYLKGAVTREKTKARNSIGTSHGKVDHVLAYACSTQITDTVVSAIREIMGMRGDMDDATWNQYHPDIAENYDEQLQRKHKEIIDHKMKLYREQNGSALKYLET
jgi:hypothetical protein